MSNKNRRQSGNQVSSLLSQILKNIKKFGLEHILSITSVLIAGIALFFTWQANNLTQEANGIMLRQVSDQLVITKIFHLGGSADTPTPSSEDNPVVYGTPDYLFCSHKIRLSNLGESTTSLVNFSVRASYRDEIAFLEGFGEAITFSKDRNLIHSLPISDIQSILISEEMLKTNPLDEKWLNNSDNGIDLPVSVSGKSSLDFVAHTIVVMNHSDDSFKDKDVIFIYPNKTFTSEGMENFDNTNKDIIPPFKMTYIFETAAGQIISTEPLSCWDIGVFPTGSNYNFTKP